MSRKATAVIAVIAALVGLGIGMLIGGGGHDGSTPQQEVIDQQDADHLAWCDSIYHQNVGCPRHDQIDIPQEVIDQQDADHLAWCDSIYHQNVGCPEYSG